MNEFDHPGRFRRFWRLFRREKAPLIDLNYSFHYMARFPRLSITVPPFVPTLMSYRCGVPGSFTKRNDDDDYELSPKNPLRHHPHQQHLRRRFSKRYSDVVGPSSNKIYLPRKDSIIREKPMKISTFTYKQSRTSFKRNNTEGLYVINTTEKKSGDIFSSFSKKRKSLQSTRRYQSKNKHLPSANTVDLLAHRMQAAMSAELMHSLDRNFVFGEKKTSLNPATVNRSQSFHIPTQTSSDSWEKSHYYHIIPRVNETFDQDFKSLSSEEPTPDYDDDVIIRPITNYEIGEEPSIDYDEPESIPTYEPEETSPTPYDLGVSSSFIAPLTSITPNSDIDIHDQSTIPPTPPPLPDSLTEQTKITFRCRTIAESITPNHKLILKDETETRSILTEEISSAATSNPSLPKKSPQNPTTPLKPSQLHLSKEVLEKTTLRKVSHPVSRSYSTYGSMSQFNDPPTDSTTFCRKTSLIDEQPFDGLSSSATTSIVIENESEHRTSSKIYNDYKRRASLTSVPTTHLHRSVHSQSAIIHPMHTHIGLRSSTSSSSNTDKPSEMILSNKQMNVCVINQLNQHLTTRFRKQQQEEEEEIIIKKNNPNIILEEKLNVYDEPHQLETCKTISTQLTEIGASSIPPPPPPLPVGGFRSIANRPLSSQRTSLMTLPHEINNNNSPGTSTSSSKLSDTRILRELRANRLFTKAKQHLEIVEPEPSNSSLSLNQSSIETFTIGPDELHSSKHPFSTSQSELELLFQKRAQRQLT